MILPQPRDPRFTTIRRGGTLADADHRLLAIWAADCAEHVLPLYEAAHPGDERVRETIALARAWAAGELKMRAAWDRAQGAQAAREAAGAAKLAARAATQAIAVAHVPAHDLGAAAYAIRAAMAAAADPEAAREAECAWQRAQLPAHLRALVLDDQRLRNPICWNVFS